MKRDIINAGIETLLTELDEDETVKGYRDKSRSLHFILTKMNRLMEGIDSFDRLKIYAQSMFETGTLKATDDCFGQGQLNKHIFATKMNESIDDFQSLHQQLTENDYTSDKGSFNSHGDNYYFALSFKVKPSENDITALNIIDKIFSKEKLDGLFDEKVDFNESAVRRVVIMKKQSGAYAAILEDDALTGKPSDYLFVRLKRHYNDVDRIPELIEKEFSLSNINGSEWSPYDDRDQSFGVVSRLDLTTGDLKDTVFDPESINGAIRSVYSGNDALTDELTSSSSPRA